MKKNKKGFTLIELLVVISIISLLSSVVMAGMTGARNKAKEKAFRSEVIQFVNALEMYRNDNVGYPADDVAGFGQSFSYTIKNNNTFTTSGPGPNLANEMSKYIKTLPNPRGNDTKDAFQYLRNNVDGSVVKYRCKGSLTIPKYVLFISPDYWGSGFDDWPIGEYIILGTPSDFTGSHCFSLN